jgi:serine/threonine protein kinase
VTGADLLAELQSSLGAAYTFDRELGGGGMARVFLAHERGLGRPVVIKLLNPELAEGINADRFEREIKLAASLQQANIVPLLSAGRGAVRVLHHAVRRGTIPSRPAYARQRRTDR